MVADVAYGSVVSVKSFRTGGGYLHSHPHLYPGTFGPQYQQVVHKFVNNFVSLRTVTNF